MKNRAKWFLALGAACLLLAGLLELFEKAGGNPDIRNYGDALWYSLVTISTVGYGDVVPITTGGKLVGVVFVLGSVGVLSALIGFSLRLIGGTLIPHFRLRLGRRRHWYAFSEENRDSAALAAGLRREEPDCLVIFPAGENGGSDDAGTVRLRFDADSLLRLRRSAAGLSAFYFGPDPWENYARATSAAVRGVCAYCLGDARGGALPERLAVFSPTEAMSRCYWNAFPLKAGERRVVLIGCGEAGCALLERALLNNVFITERGIEYHVFGETRRFSDLHPEIVKALDGTSPKSDRLCLHNEDWTAGRAVLQHADRIILCMDEDRENLAVLAALRNWYVCTAAVHIRLLAPLPGLVCFGDRESVLTPENVMKEILSRRAILMNDIYNESSPHPIAWRELSPFLRQSNLAAADHLLVKARYLLNDETLTELSGEVFARAYARYRELYSEQADLLQEMEHRRWMRFYQMYNWQYAPERSDALRRHPLLLPYERLSAEDRAKDAYAWEMLGRLAAKR